MRSANPALNNNTFRNTRRVSGEQAMSIDGTVNKTALSLLLVMTSAIYTWNNPEVGLALFWPVTIFTFVLLMITIFNKKSAPITVPLYCLAEGLVLGGISAYANALYPGIANQAIALTFGILAALLFLYKSRLIAATENFKLGIVAATGGIALLYFINFIMSFFGSGIGIISSNNTMGILFSGAVVVIAALNLVLDFDFIEEGAEMGAPKYMEWYGAFGLLVTLIWLYLEILRLLAKLSSRR